jgi:hypothetical protein
MRDYLGEFGDLQIVLKYEFGFLEKIFEAWNDFD